MWIKPIGHAAGRWAAAGLQIDPQDEAPLCEGRSSNN